MTTAPVFNAEFLTALEARIQSRAVLQHPFYQAWNQGTLTREALQDYATQYYHHVAAFPTYLSAVHSHTTDLEARRTLLQNLMDEEAGEPNHPELWLQFVEGMGVSSEAALKVALQPETEQVIATFREICQNGRFTDGVAALYSYESQIPEVAQTKIEGLKTHYGVSDEATLKYFAVHVEADEVHRAQEQDLLARCVTSESAQASALLSAERALNAVWNLLSGVCARHNIACH